jgi:ribosomal protein L29
MDQAIANGATADEAEAMAIEQIQKLGGEMLADWAEAKQQQALKQAQVTHPESIRHIKKK